MCLFSGCCGNIKPEAVFIACRYDSEHFNTAGRSVKTGMFCPKSPCRLPVCNTALDAIGTMVLDRLAISPEPALSHLTKVMQLQQHCHQPAIPSQRCPYWLTGLISVDIQSHWTWSSTLLQSANQAFQYVSTSSSQKTCFQSKQNLCILQSHFTRSIVIARCCTHCLPCTQWLLPHCA